jgi:hypothetical protein
MEMQPKKANQNEYFADADYLTSRPAVNLMSLTKRKELVYSNGAYKFTDRVDGRTFDVNLTALFNPNSPTVKDLKKLYPTEFDQAKKETDGGPRETFKWNYDYGNPLAWPDHTFGGLLPQTKDSADYRKKLVSISRDASTPALQYWLRLFM